MTWVCGHVVELLAGAFALVAALHLAGPGPIRAAYARQGFPAGYREVTGALFALAGGLLAFPATRPLGLGVAVIVMFLSAITLLSKRQYGVAVPVIALLFALIPVSLSVSA